MQTIVAEMVALTGSVLPEACTSLYPDAVWKCMYGSPVDPPGAALLNAVRRGSCAAAEAAVLHSAAAGRWGSIRLPMVTTPYFLNAPQCVFLNHKHCM